MKTILEKIKIRMALVVFRYTKNDKVYSWLFSEWMRKKELFPIKK